MVKRKKKKIKFKKVVGEISEALDFTIYQDLAERFENETKEKS